MRSREVAVFFWAVVAILGLGILLFPVPNPGVVPVDRHFRVEASQYAFTPGTLAVNPGDRVTIDVVATDVVHGLYVDGYDLSVTADPGQTARLTFVADRPGSFRFRCSVACGDMHPFMIGRLKVGPNWLLLRAIGLSVLGVFAVRVVARRQKLTVREEATYGEYGICSEDGVR